MLVGDLAHAEADQLVTSLPRPMRQIWRLLVVELVHGQSRDLTGSASGRRDLDHARRVARMKSGRYTVERPLELGAAAAGAPDEVRDALMDTARRSARRSRCATTCSASGATRARPASPPGTT